MIAPLAAAVWNMENWNSFENYFKALSADNSEGNFF